MLGIGVIIYNFLILAGTAYLVAIYDWSGWWFVATFMLMMGIKDKDKDKEKDGDEK
jgi:hypothetical protein